MRYVVYGAGAIGGAIGGRLFEAGADVTLVARGAHLDVLRDRGLTLVSADGTVTLPVPVVGYPAEARPAAGDVVILAMKSQGTLDAVTQLARYAPPGIRVACAQNGVENERVALRSFAEVYGVNVMLPALHLSPGEVVAHASPVTGVLDVGRYPVGHRRGRRGDRRRPAGGHVRLRGPARHHALEVRQAARQPVQRHRRRVRSVPARASAADPEGRVGRAGRAGPPGPGRGARRPSAAAGLDVAGRDEVRARSERLSAGPVPGSSRTTAPPGRA